MRRYGGPALLLLTGTAVLRITLFGDLYLRYVQAGLRPYLLVSGAALVLLGLVGLAGLVTTAIRGRTRETDRHDTDRYDTDRYDTDRYDTDRYDTDRHDTDPHDTDPHDTDPHGTSEPGGHGHPHGPAGPRVAWLLTLPALALLLFPPPALGSYSAGREAAQRAAQGVGTFPALPAGDPVTLTVGAYSSRAIYDSSRSLKGRTVRLTGFVTHGDDGAWYVTRLLVSCCAADATTAKAEIRGADAPPADTWVTVTGTWRPHGALGSDAAWPPLLAATAVTRVEQPADPYEKP